ncbi:MAG: sugar phosphate isomerase/epimerase [Clostridia bacterium]|nr:sugar phosphate isomerase/epimerase [Clostridia bacterium]
MLPTALQVYSVRTDAERDLAGTFKAIKSYGYDGVELAGLYGKSAKEFARVTAASGLVPVSAHVPLADLRADTGKIISDYKEIGCKNIVVPYLPQEDRPGTPGWKNTVKDVRAICEKLTDKGFTVSYHNHDFEFALDGNGDYYLDALYSAIPAELLKAEIDVCWARVGGVDPAEYLEKYAERIPLVHLKDYAGGKSDRMYALIGVDDGKEAQSEFEFRPLGRGVQDMKKIIASAEKSGAEWLIVEQDEPSMGLSRLECAKISADYLKTI